MKKQWILCAVGAVVVIVIGTLFYINSKRALSSFITTGCDGVRYEQTDGTGYLTILYDNTITKREIDLAVYDTELQQELSGAEMSNIIGVSMTMKIPYGVVRENHIDTKHFNAFEYIASSQYDSYLSLADVYYK